MVYIIADACVNFRNLSDADKLISKVTATGCDCIKFQAFKEEHIKGHPRFEELKNIILTESDIRYLYYRCNSKGISLLVTPFYPECIEWIDPYVEMWKIRYTDRHNIEILKACMDTGKEILISEDTLDNVIKVPQIKSLYCIPDYPPKDYPDYWNDMKSKGFDGYSCHIPDISWFTKNNYDLDYLEVHVRLDKYQGGWEPIDQKVSITVSELKKLCREIQ